MARFNPIITYLPSEIVCTVTEYLDLDDLISLSKVSRAARDFARVDHRTKSIRKLHEKGVHLRMLQKIIDNDGMLDHVTAWHKCKGRIDVQKFRDVMILIYKSEVYAVEKRLCRYEHTSAGSLLEIMLYITRNKEYTDDLNFMPWLMVTTFIDRIYNKRSKILTAKKDCYQACADYTEHVCWGELFNRARYFVEKFNGKLMKYTLFDPDYRVYSKDTLLLLIINYHLSFVDHMRNEGLAPNEYILEDHDKNPGLIDYLDYPIDVVKILAHHETRISCMEDVYVGTKSELTLMKTLATGDIRLINVLCQTSLASLILVMAPSVFYSNHRFSDLRLIYDNHCQSMDLGDRLVIGEMIRKGLLYDDILIDEIEAKMIKSANIMIMDAWKKSSIMIYNKKRFDAKYAKLMSQIY